MSAAMKKQPRWMASVLKTAEADLPALPFQRGKRRTLALRLAGPQKLPRALKTA